MELSPDQARALWSAGGFLILSDLPQGSEFGVDGTYHTVRRFSGVKFVPPGLHLFTWTPAYREDSSRAPGAGPGALPIRNGLLHHFAARERLVRKYDPALENVPHQSADGAETIISDDGLRTLDSSMAAYPFEGLDTWKKCASHVSPAIVEAVVGAGGRVDGMMEVHGEALTGDQDLRKAMKEMQEQQDGQKGAAESSRSTGTERKLHFVEFDIKRSWPPGSVGEEVTKWSMDKSWLLEHVAGSLHGGRTALLGQLQLAYILLIHLSAAPCLAVYQRILRLFCQSRSILSSTPSQDANIPKIYVALLETLDAQLQTLPTDAFVTELPEVDAFYLEQLETLRKTFSLSMGLWKAPQQEEMTAAWSRLAETGRTCFSWSIPPLSEGVGDEDEDEEYAEEGEDAPTIVEM